MRNKLADLLALPQASSSPISRLILKAENTAHYQEVFDTALPSELRGHICFANLNNGLITVIAPNAAIATQVRIQQSDILKSLQKYDDFRYVWQIKAKVRPVSVPFAKKSAPPVISTKIAKLLREEARLCDDKEIAEVLSSLASHAKNPTG